MGEVVELGVITTLSIPCEKVLAKASELQFDRVIVIGVTKDGDEFFSSSEADGGCILWDMERAKHKLMTIGDDYG